VTPSRIAVSVPDLAPDAVASLRPRRPLLVRRAVAVVAGAAAAALVLLVRPDSPSSDAGALRSAVALVPWVLALPWLKKLDMRPVLWFFGCVLCAFAAPLLAGRVAYRALSLPYRDWEIADWNLERRRAVPTERALVLVDAEEVPEARSPREAAWRRFLSVGWAVVIVSFAGLAAVEMGGAPPAATTDALHAGWFAAAALVGAVQLVGEFLLGRAERRAAAPAPASAQ
jgi:hypothetical protein